MKIIGLIVICVLMALFAVGSFIENLKTKEEIRKLKKQEKENAKIDNETLENIHDVAGGDIHAGNNILHNLATKEK